MIKTSTKIYLAILGVAFIFLGTMCLCHPGATLLSLSLFIGISTLISGISSVCLWARARAVLPQSGATLFTGILDILIAFFFLRHSEALAFILPIVFGCWLMVEGIGLAIKSTDFKDVGFRFWWILCLLGVLVSLLGFQALKSPLAVGGGVISAVVGISTILIGVTYLLSIAGINKFRKKRFTWIDDSVDEQ